MSSDTREGRSGGLEYDNGLEWSDADDRFYRGLYGRGMSYARAGNKYKAKEIAQELEGMGVDKYWQYAGKIYARTGLKRDAQRIIKKLESSTANETQKLAKAVKDELSKKYSIKD